MSRAAYPSRVAIAHALASLADKAAETSNYRGPLAQVHELLSQDPPKVESAAVAAGVGVELTCKIQPEVPAERQAEAWLLAAVHELLSGAITKGAAPAASMTDKAAPADIDPELRRLAVHAAAEVSALSASAERLIDSGDEDSPAVFLMLGRMRALGDVLYGILEGPEVAPSVEEMRALMDHAKGGAA